MKKNKLYKFKSDFICDNFICAFRGYYVGYIGIRLCKVAVCIDCGKIEYIGGWFWKWLYPILKKIKRNRIEIIKTVTYKHTREDWHKELERFGREKQ